MKNWRFNFIFFIFFLIGLVILSKLFFIQVLNFEFWRALAQGQQKKIDFFEGERGEIFIKDKEGNIYLLASNEEKIFCYLNKEKIGKEKIEKLSEILGLEKENLIKKIEKEKKKIFLLAQFEKKVKEKLRKIKIEGFFCENKKIRIYPQKKFASKILGFVGGEGKGQYGIEGYWEDFLKGKMILKVEEWNPWKFSLKGIEKSFQKGDDLFLTLDYNIQKMAEKILKEGIEKFEAKSGEIIVISPKEGKILALAQFPSFDPNEYYKVKNQEIFKNTALQKLFEPGSIFKPIVMAGALEDQKITPKTIYEDKGFVKIGKNIIKNYGGKIWGKRTMREVLEKSINTGAVFVQKKLGQKNFLKYIQKFGFFEKTGIDLQGEVFSENKNLKKGKAINFATASFGQGIEVTSIQIVRAFSAIANGGDLLRPYLVEEIVRADGKKIKIKTKIQRKKIISEKTAHHLTQMLLSVVENGFGKGAKIEGYYIAGKTGTAQVPFSALGIKKRGYSQQTLQSFVGFFPAFDPKFLIFVKLENPKTKTAEYSAVPLFKKLAKYIIEYWQIPPDYIEED